MATNKNSWNGSNNSGLKKHCVKIVFLVFGSIRINKLEKNYD